jgi:hypothetical protein
MRSQLIDVNNIRLGKHLGIRYNVPRARVKSITKQTKMLKGMRNVLQGEVEGFLSDGTGYTAKQVEVVQKLFHGENVKGISAAQERAVVAIWKEEVSGHFISSCTVPDADGFTFPFVRCMQRKRRSEMPRRHTDD